MNNETREQTMEKITFYLPTLTDENGGGFHSRNHKWRCRKMSKEEMIQATVEAMRKLFYEDVEFFYKFVTGFARRKGLK